MSRNVRVVATVGRDQVDDADHVGRRLLDRHAELLHRVGQARLRRLNLVLHVHRGDVERVADVEGGDDLRQPVARAVRGEVRHPLDAVHLLLDRRRHRVGDRLGVGAGVGRRDLDLRRDDLGIERNRQQKDADAPDQEHQEGNHRREDRPFDEEVDHEPGSCLCRDVGRLQDGRPAHLSSARRTPWFSRPLRDPSRRARAGATARLGSELVEAIDLGRLGRVPDHPIEVLLLNLDLLAGPDELDAIDDDLLTRLEARPDHADPRVGIDRIDGLDRHHLDLVALLALLDDVDRRPRLPFDDGPVGHDDHVVEILRS